jgi:hypothetical protein
VTTPYKFHMKLVLKTNVATVRNSEVIRDKFNVSGNCATVNGGIVRPDLHDC